MADQSVVHIGENSPEEVALKLFRIIADVEQKALHFSRDREMADRNYILNTYLQCRRVVEMKPPT